MLKVALNTTDQIKSNQALIFILQKRSLNWQIAKINP